jgi:hypothetical protein
LPAALSNGRDDARRSKMCRIFAVHPTRHWGVLLQVSKT